MRVVSALLLVGALGLAQDAAPPEFTATLCQGWDKNLTPEGPTRTFFTDSATVRMVYRTAKAPAAGHTIITAVFKMGGEKPLLVQRGRPLQTNGQSNVFASGFQIAGQQWARAGGTFRFAAFWDKVEGPVVEEEFTITPAQRWALLVGVSDYPPKGKGGSDLPACHKDAERMRDLLVSSFGFQPQRITVVQSLEATTARIDRELVALTQKAGPQDAVLFYYAGHGTQIPDLNGDEADGWDEALATAEAFPEVVTTEDHLKRFLSDDRIAEILAMFKTRNVTVIFDSCHSGTAVRAAEDEDVDAPGMYRGMRKNQGFGRKLVEKAEDADRSQPRGVAQGLDIDQRYVFISAAQSWETAMGNQDGGIFSRNLREVLRTSNGESWERMVQRIRLRAQMANPGQSPQAEGAIRRYPFSTAEAPADAPFVRPTLTAFGVFLNGKPGLLAEGKAGTHSVYVSGMTGLALEQAGVECDVYPFVDQSYEGQPKGRIRLTGRMAPLPRPGGAWHFASATIVSGKVQRGDRLVPRSVRVPGAKPSIGLTFLNGTAQAALDRMKSTVQAVVNLLRAEQSVTMKTEGGLAGLDYVVVPQVKGNEVIANIYTPTSQFVGSVRGSASDIAKDVREIVVTRHVEFSRINRVSNPSPSFRLRTVVKGGAGRHRPGAKLEFTGYTDTPAYIFAFAASEGGPAQLITRSDQPLLPDKPFHFQLPTHPQLKGRLVIKVFASTKPIDYAKIDQATPGGRADALLGALRAAYPAGGAEFIGTDGWADESIWIELR